MSGHDDRKILQEQKDYYRARAGEYDEWFQRLGRYDKGEDNKKRWFSQTEEVRKALDGFSPRGRVLELACGTGNWTGQLARHADSVLAVDSSPEVLEINKQKTKTNNVSYIEADLFGWRPDERFDAVFCGFWLTHVPPNRFEWFWKFLRECLKSGGGVFVVDSYHEVGVLDVVNPRNVLIADAFDAVAAKAVLQHGRALKCLRCNELGTRVQLLEVVAAAHRSART